MTESRIYRAQVELLLQVLPLLDKVNSRDGGMPTFSLKGGTAINLFVRDMPRLSVDIDLTYLPLQGRDESLRGIAGCLRDYAARIKRLVPGATVHEKKTVKDKRLNKIFVERDGVVVKIEPNEILRGSIFKPEERTIATAVEEEFGVEPTALVSSFADLYGGKMCAALDRQHPRDFFDLKILFENEGITNEVRTAFVVCLVSHNRPIEELLAPNLIDIETTFETQFQGMPIIEVTCEELVQVRHELIHSLQNILSNKERLFLCSIAEGDPDWSLLDLDHIHELPAIKWKLLNVQKMASEKRKTSVKKLRSILDL